MIANPDYDHKIIENHSGFFFELEFDQSILLIKTIIESGKHYALYKEFGVAAKEEMYCKTKNVVPLCD